MREKRGEHIEGGTCQSGEHRDEHGDEDRGARTGENIGELGRGAKRGHDRAKAETRQR
jgi:hypothetical protein